MASFWEDFFWSWTTSVIVFTVLVLLATTFWIYVRGKKSLSKQNDSSVSSGNFREDSSNECEITNIENVIDIREILLNKKDLKPASLHGKALLEHGIWQEKNSILLKNFLQTKVSEEKLITEDILWMTTKKLIKHLRKKNDQLVDFSELMPAYALNVLYAVVFGKTFELDDERFLVMKDELMAIVKQWPEFNTNVQDLPQSESFDFKSAKGEFITRMKQTLMRHTPTTNVSLQNLVDALIINTGNEKTPEALAEYLLVFFVIGSESLSKFLCSAVTLLADNPGIQDKIRENLDENMTKLDSLSYSELRNTLPFIQASIQEMLRVATPVSTITRCLDSAEERENAEGQHVICNRLMKMDIAATLRDCDHWDKSYIFNPYRFLDDTEHLMHRDSFMPFSTGSRSCPGAAVVEIASFFTVMSVLRIFILYKSKSHPQEDENESSADSRATVIRVVSRSDEVPID